MNKYGLGYLQLNSQEVEAYKKIQRATEGYEKSLDASQIGRNVNLMTVLGVVLGDNPGIIYFDKTKLAVPTSLFKKQIVFMGCLSKTQTIKMNAQLNKKVQDAIWEIDKNAYRDKDILLGISEYLQRNVVYDEEEAVACTKGRSIRPQAHNAYGALVEGKAVCDGISSGFSILAQALGFRCMVVTGEALHRGINGGHAWNIVEYNSGFYHMDITWDINMYSRTNHYAYHYFGLEDDDILKDHKWDIKYTPICNSKELSYFFHHNLYANNDSQINDIIMRELKAGKEVIRIQLSYGIALPEEADKYMMQKVIDVAAKLRISIQIQCTWNENMRCFVAIIL